MPKCTECGENFTTRGKREIHMMEHLPADPSEVLAESVGEDNSPSASGEARAFLAPPSAPPTGPTKGPDPVIDPFDLPEVPSFETSEGAETSGPESMPGAPSDVPSFDDGEIIAPPAPTFSAEDLQAALIALTQATAEMAGTGPEGVLSNGEAKLIATLSVDKINEWVAVSGGDPNSAKMYLALGVVVISKGRVYVTAIQRKRQRRGMTPAREVSPRKIDPENPPAPGEGFEGAPVQEAEPGGEIPSGLPSALDALVPNEA